MTRHRRHARKSHLESLDLRVKSYSLDAMNASSPNVWLLDEDDCIVCEVGATRIIFTTTRAGLWNLLAFLEAGVRILRKDQPKRILHEGERYSFLMERVERPGPIFRIRYTPIIPGRPSNHVVECSRKAWKVAFDDPATLEYIDVLRADLEGRAVA